MKRVLLVCLFLVFSRDFVLSEPTLISGDAVIETATKWLALVDAQQYPQAWDLYPVRITSGGMKDNWVGIMRSRRFPLGDVKSRKVYKVSRQSKLRGAPDGDYSIVEFETSFEKKAGAIEEVTLTSENGYWQVSGYHFH
jgi:hypothetical protein